ncbi:MAG: hypothetical protein R3A45_01160 [Bdellovibrionota bacterium]
MTYFTRKTLPLCMLLLLSACGSIEDTTVEPNSPTFGTLEVISLDQDTLNIRWGNPALTTPFSVTVTITSSQNVKTVVVPSTETPEIQYTDAAPEKDYEITVSTTLADDSSIDTTATITTPPVQTGDYSQLTFDQAQPCQILTCFLSWSWNHPTNASSYVSKLLLQRKKNGADYWQTVAEIDGETSQAWDESLGMQHGKNYQYRMAVLHTDTTGNIVPTNATYQLSYQLPEEDFIASTTATVLSTNFSLANILGMIQPSPFEFTLDFTLNKSYTVQDLIDHIGPIQIKPLVHVVNYDSVQSTFLSDIQNQTVSQQHVTLPLVASAQNYAPGKTYSFSSQLILGTNLFSNTTDPDDWSKYDIYLSYEIVPVDQAFGAAAYFIYDQDSAFLDNRSAAKIKCTTYSCYVSPF